MSFFKLFPKIEYDFNDDGTPVEITDIFRVADVATSYLDEFLLYMVIDIQDGERPDILSTRLYGVPDYYWTFAIINSHLQEGYHKWVLSSEQIRDYVNRYMQDTVVNCIPSVVVDGDGIILRHENNIVGRFQEGETVTGLISGATGTIKSFNVDLQQILITNVTGLFQNNEIMTGSITGDRISIYKSYKMMDAPVEYVDSTGQVQSNALFVPDGVTNANLNPVTYLSKLYSVNDARRSIKVVDPNYIREFVNNFKAKIRE